MSVTTRRLRETLVRERGWFRREQARADRAQAEVKDLNTGQSIEAAALRLHDLRSNWSDPEGVHGDADQIILELLDKIAPDVSIEYRLVVSACKWWGMG